MDLNPLNESNLVHVSNQMRRNQMNQLHAPPPSGLNFNSSYLTNNDAISYSKFEPAGDDINNSTSSLWLNEDLEAAQYENRVRQY